MRSVSSSPVISAKGWRRHASTRVVLNVGVAIGGVVLARLIGSVTQFWLMRQMALSEFGLYTSLYTLLGPVIIVASLGLDTWLLRQAGAPATLNRNISQVFSLRLFTTVALMILAGGWVLTSGQPELTLPIVAAAGVSLLCELLLITAHTALRSQMRNLAAALLQVAVAALFIGLVWFFWNSAAPVLTVTSYRMLAGLVGVGLLLWLLRGGLQLVWRPSQLWGIVKQARVYFISDILANIALKADLTLIALLMAPVAAGLYSSALTIVNTTFIVPTVAMQVLLPVLARQQPGTRNFRWIVGASLAGGVCYGLFWAGVLTVGAAWVIELISGAQYREAAPLLQIMSLIPLMKSINFCWAMLMVARDAQVLRTKLQAVGAAANLAGNLAFVPLFGLLGAAWVNLATEAVLLACYSYGSWVAVRRRS